jgi:hypothetical protein
LLPDLTTKIESGDMPFAYTWDPGMRCISEVVDCPSSSTIPHPKMSYAR